MDKLCFKTFLTDCTLPYVNFLTVFCVFVDFIIVFDWIFLTQVVEL